MMSNFYRQYICLVINDFLRFFNDIGLTAFLIGLKDHKEILLSIPSISNKRTTTLLSSSHFLIVLTITFFYPH